MKGKFIVFEGIDGCGKSTHVKLLKNYLESKNILCYVTFEPTDSPIGSLIHQCMSGRIEADDKTIAGLFVADRLDHLFNKTNGIIEKLNQGYTVISDRYYFSSYAYHGVSMPMKWVIEANKLSAEALKPDINIYIDVDPKTSWLRLCKRGSLEKYEKIEYLEKVREKYFEAFETIKDEKVRIINSDKDINKTSKLIFEVIDELYK